jgi:hypothetical protein
MKIEGFVKALLIVIVSIFLGYFLGKINIPFFKFDDKIELADAIQVILSFISIIVTILLAVHISTVIERSREVEKVEKEFYFRKLDYLESLLIDLSIDISSCTDGASTVNYYKTVNVCKRLNTGIKAIYNKLSEKSITMDVNKKEVFIEFSSQIRETLTNTAPSQGIIGNYVSISNSQITVPPVLISQTDVSIGKALDCIFEIKFEINSKKF